MVSNTSGSVAGSMAGSMSSNGTGNSTVQPEDARMSKTDRLFCLPVMLLLDFGLFMYLVYVYRARRREFRVMQLLAAAFIGFAVLIPFAQDNHAKTQSLNDVSETCSQLLFLIQITIIGRTVTRKVKLRSIQFFTWFAEALIIVDWINAGMNFAQVFDRSLEDVFHDVANVVETLTLSFVLFFRFYYLSMTKGFVAVFRERRVEFVAYCLMVTHEVPIMFLEAYTNGSWEYVQGIYMRVMIIICILLNLRKRHKDSRGGRSGGTAASANRGVSSAPPSSQEQSKLSEREGLKSPTAINITSTIRNSQSKKAIVVQKPTSVVPLPPTQDEDF
ncbi:TPA: hypothetical protein N0F65_013032 [Lagenidium giganteum]|uniref:Uncharacterized protein n=1 Tax=Lagenidium giganteum TaxID=4803 RepID=A0AAV2YPJ9_9STRA|nr:TPA: hypothetical protein N0F65_013032 [Lagenidium giganteum]